MFPKPKRERDRKLLDLIKEQNCAACNSWPSDPDHIQTRGAGGPDSIANVWPLCRRCHIERHQIGMNKFLQKHPKAQEYLLRLKKV